MKVPDTGSILLVDDDETILALCDAVLEKAGYPERIPCADAHKVDGILSDNEIFLMVLDINMPGISGIEILEAVTTSHPRLPVIMVTGEDDLETVVRCMKIGAYDYLGKPLDQTRFLTAVRNALEWRSLQQELSALGERVLHRDVLEHSEAFDDIITISREMVAIFQYVEAVAPTPRPVLITGESGTGKELLARSIHQISGRKGPLVTVNAAGLDDNLFSDTLFGHRKGAFTGADTDRPGLVEKASGGTLFLDEIGDLNPASQVKLLRLLQESEFYPLGSDEPRTTDARILTATCADLDALLVEGIFRRDLYFRLMAHHVHIPPLKDRADDLLPLADAFCEMAAEELGKKRPRLPDELKPLLKIYPFPGNVRELQSLIFDAVSRTGGTVMNLAPFREKVGSESATKVAESMSNAQPQEINFETLSTFFGKFPTVKEMTDSLIDAAIDKAEGNQSLAAKILGVNQSTLSRRLSRKGEE